MNETILLRLTKTGKEILKMKKCIALLIICTLFLFGCATNAENGYPTAPKPTLPEHTPEPAAVKVEAKIQLVSTILTTSTRHPAIIMFVPAMRMSAEILTD